MVKDIKEIMVIKIIIINIKIIIIIKVIKEIIIIITNIKIVIIIKVIKEIKIITIIKVFRIKMIKYKDKENYLANNNYNKWNKT